MSSERLPLGPECKRCKAPVLMLKNDKSGKFAPIDPEPVAGGNITVDPASGTYRVVPKDELALSPNKLRHKSHFATCEFAAEFRR